MTLTSYYCVLQEASHALVVNYWNATVVVLEMDKQTGAIKQSKEPKCIFDPNKGRIGSEGNKLAIQMFDSNRDFGTPGAK